MYIHTTCSQCIIPFPPPDLNATCTCTSLLPPVKSYPSSQMKQQLSLFLPPPPLPFLQPVPQSSLPFPPPDLNATSLLPPVKSPPPSQKNDYMCVPLFLPPPLPFLQPVPQSLSNEEILCEVVRESGQSSHFLQTAASEQPRHAIGTVLPQPAGYQIHPRVLSPKIHLVV